MRGLHDDCVDGAHQLCRVPFGCRTVRADHEP
jgi:hypothetical protein